MMPRRVRFLITAASYQRVDSDSRSPDRRHRGGDPGPVRHAVEEGRIGATGKHSQLGRRDQAKGDRLVTGAVAIIGPMQTHGAEMVSQLVDGEDAPRPDPMLLEEGEQAGVLL